jgi:phosphoglycolate phosphatase
MMPHKNAIFDLDGTLTDSKPGILGCLRKALEFHHIPWTEPLDWFIGPPAEQSLRRLMPDADESHRLTLLRDYRKCYDATGWAENSVYPGIYETLESLKHSGWEMFVCTAKREDFTLRILEKFRLGGYFRAVYADKETSIHHSKTTLLRRLLEEQRLDKNATLMIGDRHFDMEAAHKNEVTAVAVTYGYGTAEELAACTPHYTCHTVKEILPVLTGIAAHG